MEQILIRNLSDDLRTALQIRAKRNQRSIESEAREILIAELANEQLTLVDLLSDETGSDIDFEPERLGLLLRGDDLGFDSN